MQQLIEITKDKPFVENEYPMLGYASRYILRLYSIDATHTAMVS